MVSLFFGMCWDKFFKVLNSLRRLIPSTSGNLLLKSEIVSFFVSGISLSTSDSSTEPAIVFFNYSFTCWEDVGLFREIGRRLSFAIVSPILRLTFSRL